MKLIAIIFLATVFFLLIKKIIKNEKRPVVIEKNKADEKANKLSSQFKAEVKDDLDFFMEKVF